MDSFAGIKLNTLTWESASASTLKHAQESFIHNIQSNLGQLSMPTKCYTRANGYYNSNS